MTSSADWGVARQKTKNSVSKEHISCPATTTTTTTDLLTICRSPSPAMQSFEDRTEQLMEHVRLERLCFYTENELLHLVAHAERTAGLLTTCAIEDLTNELHAIPRTSPKSSELKLALALRYAPRHIHPTLLTTIRS